MRPYESRGLAVLLSVCAGGAQSLAQCPWEWQGSALELGIVGRVIGSVVWDPDGPGPAPDMLVLGGAFDWVDDGPAHNLIAWTGTGWQRLGDTDGLVRSLTVHNGDLVICGEFTNVGGVAAPQVAMLSGGVWTGIGGQFSISPRRILSVNGVLYAGGRFYMAPTGPSFIAKWSGSGNQWQAVGGGVNHFVHSLGEYEGELLVGGVFNLAGNVNAPYLARWDGATWRAFPAPVPTVPYCFGVHQGQLIVGGIGDDWGAGAVCRWNGLGWDDWGTGLYGYNPKQWYGVDVYAVGSSGAELFVGGLFVGDFARFVQPGLYEIQEVDGAASTFATYRGLLHAGGSFQSASGRIGGSLAVRDAGQWRPLVPHSDSRTGVAKIAVDGDSAYIAGDFRSQLAAGTIGQVVARWDGERLEPMPGLGLQSDRTTRPEIVLADGTVLAYGELTLEGQELNIARWTVDHWIPFSWPETSPPSTMLMHEGTLLALNWSGLLQYSGDTWLPFAATPANTHSVISVDGQMLAISGWWWQTQHSAHRWTGTGWEQLGMWPARQILAVASHHGILYAGGQYSVGEPIGNLHRWDGASWIPVPSLTAPRDGEVRALASVGDHLFAAGWESGDTSTATVLLRGGSNGLTRVPGPGGVSPHIWALAPFRGGVLLGGRFSWVDGKASPFLTHYGPAHPGCTANCDCSTTAPVLTVSDFACFLARFASGDPYANCDQSTAAPAINVADFTCFLQRFAAGCG